MSLAAEVKSILVGIEAYDSLGMSGRVAEAQKLEQTLEQMQTLLTEIRERLKHVAHVPVTLFNAFGQENHRHEIAKRVLNSAVRMLERNYIVPAQEGSLHAEDRELEKLLPTVSGYYVDVGAWRPVEQSNTWRFYKRGWRGLLIEPVPQAWPALLTQRVGDYLVPFAASNENGVARIYVNGPTTSFRPDWDLYDTVMIPVETRTLEYILSDFPLIQDRCELCSIDVEGHERQVLEGIDWNKFRPEVFIIEFVTPEHQDISKEWIHILFEHGYVEHMRIGLNIIFRRTDELPGCECESEDSDTSIPVVLEGAEL